MEKQSFGPIDSILLNGIGTFFYTLFHQSIEAILISDEDGKILMSNARCLELLGYEEAELMGQPVEVLIPERLIESHIGHRKKFKVKPLKRPMGTGRDLVAKRKDGKEIAVEISLNPLEIEGYIFVITRIVEVSKRRKTEKLLKDQKALLSSIIANTVDGIITINTEGVIESVNPAAAKLFGYSPEEIIGKKVNMLMPEPHRSAHDTYIDNYHQTGIAKIIGIGREVKGLKKDGTVFPFRLSISKVKYNESTIYTGIVHDLTSEKEAEQKLKNYAEELEKRVASRTEALGIVVRDLEKQVEENKEKEKALRESQMQLREALAQEQELNELKSRFVSMASHEFRTPLATILTSVSLIDKYDDPEQLDRKKKHINRVKSNVRNLNNILNDFLSVSKLEEGKIKADSEWMDLSGLLQEALDDITPEAKKGQEFITNWDGEKREVFLDPKLIRNILNNLLSNAIKYSPEGKEIHLNVYLRPGELTLEVKDNGIGIPEAEQVHLFERFFRARNVTNIQGTGLGLSIVKKYVELMGGEITCESKENHGTSILLTFPQINQS